MKFLWIISIWVFWKKTTSSTPIPVLHVCCCSFPVAEKKSCTSVDRPLIIHLFIHHYPPLFQAWSGAGYHQPSAGISHFCWWPRSLLWPWLCHLKHAFECLFQHCEIVCKNVLHLLTLEMAWINARTHPASGKYVGGFLKCWYPTTFGFPTKNDHLGVFGGYHHFRKHPYRTHPKRFGGFDRPTLGAFMGVRRLEPASSCRTREGGVPPAHLLWAV